jgi:HTH-type transcriptional regulator / antitoxin HipB
MQVKYSEALGRFIRNTRKSIGATQKDLALTSGTGLRFIIDLEKGKPTCQMGKVLNILQNLGVKVDLIPPIAINSEKLD